MKKAPGSPPARRGAALRSPMGGRIHFLKLPLVSAIPMYIGGTMDQVEFTSAWLSHGIVHPAVLESASTTSSWIPAAASAATCVQLTASRSAGVRATPARKRALKEVASWMNSAWFIASPPSVLNQSFGMEIDPP